MSAESPEAITTENTRGIPNAVRAGTIGIAGSGATAGREVAVRVHDFGGGVSQVISTTNRDPSDGSAAGAVVAGLRRLQDDPATQVIVLVVAKPAADDEARIREQLRHSTKPVVVCFIGGSAEGVVSKDVRAARTTKEAALQAVLLTGRREEDIDLHALNWPLIEEVRAKLVPKQRYVRGLFVGSDLCAEAMYLAMGKYEDVYSNIHPDLSHRLDARSPSVGHTFLDFGGVAAADGSGSQGSEARVARFLQEAGDPEVGVITLDFIIGRDALEDPVAGILPSIMKAKGDATAQGRHLEVLAYVLGTDLDTPNVAERAARLEAAGVTIASSSANTGLLSREFVAKE